VNHTKFGRFLGVGRSYAGEVPPVQVHMPLGYLARVPMTGGTAIPGTVGAFMGHRILDPPVGGFNDGAILDQFPGVNSFAAITSSPIVPAGDHNFGPGLYRISANCNLSFGSSKGLRLMFVNADLSPGQQAIGSMDPPEIGFINPGAAAVTFAPVDTEGYFAGLWYIAVVAVGAWADANVGTLWVSVAPLHLLDEISSAR
jgi:hypothetical protein